MSSRAICFDARMSQASGIGTYIRGLLNELSASPAQRIPLTLLTGPQDGLPERWPRIPVRSPFYSLTEQLTVPRAFQKSGAGLLHVPHYNIPVMMASRCVVTVHDLIHLKFPEFLPSRLAALYANAFFHRWIPKTRAILTVSENTKRDLIQMLNIPEDKITVTYPGVPVGFQRPTPNESQRVLDALGFPKTYFLYVGNLKEFKNVQRLLAAHKNLRRKHTYAPALVFVGKNFIPGFDRELESASAVHWFPDVGRDLLPSIYSGALALVFPSLYEGFGLPPLEAMACGTPVICSNRGSLPEVVGEAALQVDPLSLDDIESAMRRLMDTPSLAIQLSAKGLVVAKRFSWARTAEKTLAVYQQCL